MQLLDLHLIYFKIIFLYWMVYFSYFNIFIAASKIPKKCMPVAISMEFFSEFRSLHLELAISTEENHRYFSLIPLLWGKVQVKRFYTKITTLYNRLPPGCSPEQDNHRLFNTRVNNYLCTLSFTCFYNLLHSCYTFNSAIFKH